MYIVYIGFLTSRCRAYGDSDKINEVILSCFIRNARLSSHDISKKLKSYGIKRTPRSIRKDNKL
jgi:hypothetical protein